MTRKTSVVIPYYQEDPGILRDAVISAVAQEGVTDLEIIVVDDGSPAPARYDLEGLDLPAYVTLKLIEQPNRGPGAARNRALDSVSPGTVYVAFLDSDDRWTANHLRSAQCALREDCGFYFADVWMTTYESTRFSKQNMRLDQHALIDVAQNLYGFHRGFDRNSFEIMRFVHTSTIVFPFQALSALRFREEFFIGEDAVFCFELVKRSRKITFSANVGCITGRGIHIWQDSGWDSSRAIWRLCHDIRWRKWLGKNRLRLSEEIDENKKQINRLRKEFALNLLHEMRNKRAFRNPDIMRFFKTDPAAVLCAWHVAAQEILKKIRGRRF